MLLLKLLFLIYMYYGTDENEQLLTLRRPFKLQRAPSSSFCNISETYLLNITKK